MRRREFLAGTLAATTIVRAPRMFAAEPKPRRILLSNGWHCVNIGDIAHAPGMLRLIETHLPGTEVTMWPYRELTPEVRRMLTAAFPRLTLLAAGGADDAGRPVRSDLVEAIERSDLLVVGSGGMHTKPIATWRAATDKPFGAYGVSFDKVSSPDVLSQAKFLYCRDTVSLAVLRNGGVRSPVVEFAPDSTFGLDLRDDARGDAYLRRVGLAGEPFLAVIPRARYSPYPQIYGYEPKAEERTKQAENEAHATADHAALRELIVRWVRETGYPVLACPEMTYQVPLAKEQLVDPLPTDVKSHVVWRDSFWLCDEAASVFARAALVVSVDCHAPIIAQINGTPAIHIRLPTDTKKSRMFADIGLGEWCLELKDATSGRLTELALAAVRRPEDVKRKLAAAMEKVHALQTSSLATLGSR